MVNAHVHYSVREKKFCVVFGSNLKNYSDGIILAFYHGAIGDFGAIINVEFTEDMTRELYLSVDGGFEELFEVQLQEAVCEQFVQVAKLNKQMEQFADIVLNPAVKQYEVTHPMFARDVH